ncbi:MAG: CPBP family intramembrane metalloprotease [Spirochaetaceae bacterium]|nr:MAG: CPBP family intramembrane metalloprotease [Spirochaetaceae bacterium]
MNVTGNPAVRKELFVVIAVFLVPPIVVRGGTTLALSVTQAAIEVLSSGFQLIIVLAVARRTDGTPPRGFGLSWPRLRDAIAAILAIIVLAVAAVAYLSLAPGETERFTVTAHGVVPWISVFLAVVIAIAAAYREEFLYRVYIVRRFAEAGYTPFAAVAFGAIVFGAAHLSQGVAAAVYATILGAALSVVYIVTGSLHGLAIAHAAYNISVIVRRIPGVW